MRPALFVFALAAALSSPIHAAVVADSLPYTGSPDWSDYVSPNIGYTTLTLDTNGNSSTLMTDQFAGVYFGNFAGDPVSWSLGTASQGNQLSMTAAFSTNAAGWGAYMYDKSYMAAFDFNANTPSCGLTNVYEDCYSKPYEQGVRVWHATGNDATQLATTFLPLDLSSVHTFEWLLKNGQVSYRVDGDVVYAGVAYALGTDSPMLYIGDTSGSTGTGVGSMTIYGHITWDNAPALDTLAAPVPEPETYAMMVAGLGLLGFVIRKKQNSV